MRKLSSIFNQRQNETLPSDTVKNPRTDGSCMAITTRSDKMLSSPELGIFSYTDVVEIDYEMVDESSVVPIELGGLEKKSEEVEQPPKTKNVNDVEQGIRKEVKFALVEIQRSPPPFPQQLKKNEDEGKFKKFMDMLKQLIVNVSLLEALE